MSTAMRQTLAVATPNWGFDLDTVDSENWILRITNRGTMSSTFVPVRVGISGHSSASVEDFTFSTAGHTHLQPGETIEYRIHAVIEQRAKRSWQKDQFCLELEHIAIYSLGIDSIAIPLPEWMQHDAGPEIFEFNEDGDLIEA